MFISFIKYNEDIQRYYIYNYNKLFFLDRRRFSNERVLVKLPNFNNKRLMESLNNLGKTIKSKSEFGDIKFFKSYKIGN